MSGTGTSDGGGNCRVIVQGVWSDHTVTHCVLTGESDVMRSLGDAPADTKVLQLVKYRLIYPDGTGRLSAAIQESLLLTKRADESDS